MEEPPSDSVLSLGRVISYLLIKNDVSTDEYPIWQQILKPVVLNQNLAAMEFLFEAMDMSYLQIRCRHCGFALQWTNHATNPGEIIFLCTECQQSKPLLQCNIEETVQILIELLEKHNTQILASAIRYMLISGNLLNSLSPPEVPDNPFIAIKSICENSSESLKFGGPNTVILVDIYHDRDMSEFPILYLADTISIPTRYFFQVLKFNSEYYNPKEGKNQEKGFFLPRYKEEYLVRELTELANKYAKAKSGLVLGRQLQQFIAPEIYAHGKHNFVGIVPFESLRLFDKFKKHRFDVTGTYIRIISSARKICDTVQVVIKRCTKSVSQKSFYDYLQLHFDVVMWLLTFRETPFESLLYHIIQSKTPRE